MAHRFSSNSKILYLIVGLAVLPALLLLSNEFLTLNNSEKLIQSLYERQIGTIIFSANQNALDVVENWRKKYLQRYDQTGGAQDFAEQFSLTSPAIRATFLADSAGGDVEITDGAAENEIPGAFALSVKNAFAGQAEEIRKMFDQQRQAGYAAIQPVVVNDPSAGDWFGLYFGMQTVDGQSQIGGFLIDPQSFVRDEMGPSLTLAAGESFRIGVFNETTETVVFSQKPMNFDEIKTRRDLWLFPDYVLGLKNEGQTIEELASDRFNRSLIVISVLSAVLIIGLGFVYYSVKKQLELAKLKSDFVANVSHELKTPLALIRMFGETLEMGRVPTEERKQEYYRIISRETERLTHLINNILNFSRMEAGEKTYEMRSLQLNEVIREVMDTYAFQFKNKGFECSLSLTDDTTSISGDKDALTEVIINLLDNAIKYSVDDKRVEVSSGRRGRDVFIGVRDFGVGLAEDQKQKSFEKFYRVGSSLVHDTKGTGLGLSLVKHIVAAHDGRIEVDSKPGEGSSFRIFIPATDAKSIAATQQNNEIEKV